MRKIVMLMMSVIFFMQCFAQEAKIATFNVLKLGNSPKDYAVLSEVINHFDVVGLEEVLTSKGLEKLVKELNQRTNEKWDYHISPFPVGTQKYKEYYAYVWKKDKVKFLASEGFYPDTENKFVREPYGASFQIGNFDFTLVLQHAIYGKNKKLRREEAAELVNVYDYFQNKNKIENDILIGGDFNLRASDAAFKKIRAHHDQIIHTIDPRIKTTVGLKKLSNSYDNIFLSKIHTKEFTGKSGTVDFTKNKFKLMRNKVSDHLPVFIEVNTDEDDD